MMLDRLQTFDVPFETVEQPASITRPDFVDRTKDRRKPHLQIAVFGV